MNNEKKKLIVVIALFVVVLGVGAFQFMGSRQEAPTTAKVAKKSGTDAEYSADKPIAGQDELSAQSDATEEYSADRKDSDPLTKLYAMALNTRDPFVPIEALKPNEEVKPVQPPVHNPVQRPWRGNELNIPPMWLLPGNLQPTGLGDPGVSLPTVPQGPQFSVSGVIRGSQNAAVISDAQGNQRLIREGQDLDGDHKIVSVQKNKVVIRKKDGKTITLSVGGNP